jgi:hypothetical protein
MRMAAPGDAEAVRRLADPFRHSADAARLLKLRRYQLLRQGGDVGPARSLLRRLLPRGAG